MQPSTFFAIYVFAIWSPCRGALALAPALTHGHANVRIDGYSPGTEASRIDARVQSPFTAYKDDILYSKHSNLDQESSVVFIPSNRVSPQSVTLNLINNLGHRVYAYFSGLDENGRIVFIKPNSTLVYPSSRGSRTPVKIHEDIVIDLPYGQQTFQMSIPGPITSGRIYFSRGQLQFSMLQTEDNKDGLVQPSVHNSADPNNDIDWGFVELTMTKEGVVWSNISFVDFVGLIVSMHLQSLDGVVQKVIGLAGDAVTSLCARLEDQGKKDGLPWGSSCVFGSNGSLLRVLGPQHIEGFANYWNDYVDKVWDKFALEPLVINTQNRDLGSVECRVLNGTLECGGERLLYKKPTANDIWGCNSGPFKTSPKTDSPVHLAIVPRLCAAFTRTSLCTQEGNQQPSPPSTYYTTNPTHHYSRIIHEMEIDKRGYAFPYDDVAMSADEDYSGLITSSNPKILSFFIGGSGEDQ